MEPAFCTKIEDRALVPPFDLPATKGRRVQPWTYKGQRNLVLFFLPDILRPDARSLLQELSLRYPEYTEHNAEVLVVSQNNIESLRMVSDNLDLPFPLVSDVEGSATARYTICTPAAFVIDRYGELYAQLPVGAGGSRTEHQQIMTWLGLIELECPECGVSTWER